MEKKLIVFFLASFFSSVFLSLVSSLVSSSSQFFSYLFFVVSMKMFPFVSPKFEDMIWESKQYSLILLILSFPLPLSLFLLFFIFGRRVHSLTAALNKYAWIRISICLIQTFSFFFFAREETWKESKRERDREKERREQGI